MSKIQKALNKLQKLSDGSLSERLDMHSHDDTLPLGTLIDVPRSDERAAEAQILKVHRTALLQAGLIAPEYHEQLIASQYREIKRPILANAFAKGAMHLSRGNLVMVTSALSGEGKTFSSINLAMSLSQEKDRSVLLVDADVANPRASQLLGCGEKLGLLDLLEKPDLQVQSLVLSTDIPGLCVLPAGAPRAHATELLASTAMDRICETLSTANTTQVIIFDSPPMMQTTEAKVLAGVAGQIVMVVRAGKTSQEIVLETLKLFNDAKAVNLILNGVQSSRGYGAYGYGYGYGYGHATSTTSSLKKPTK